MKDNLENVRVVLVRALVECLQTVDWEQASWSDESPEEMADRMFASLPTVFINEPAVGACYMTRGLVVWRAVTRQAIYQGRRSGRLLGLLHGKGVVYPALQFSETGRPFPEIRALLATLGEAPTDAGQAAAWLDTVDHRSGQSPRELLRTAAGRQADANRLPELSQVRIVKPEKPTSQRLTAESR